MKIKNNVFICTTKDVCEAPELTKKIYDWIKDEKRSKKMVIFLKSFHK